MLGFQWANELHAHLPEYERQTRIRDTFLRYEQLTGYLRYLAGDGQIMGITRVSRRMDDAKGQVSFGMGAEEQILSDQACGGSTLQPCGKRGLSGAMIVSPRILARAIHPIDGMTYKEFLYCAYTLAASTDRLEFLIQKPDIH